MLFPNFLRVDAGYPMDLRIADTFTDSLARLTGDEQKAVKTTAFSDTLASALHTNLSAPMPETSKSIDQCLLQD